MRTSLRLMTSALALAAGAGMIAALVSAPAVKAQTIEKQQALNGTLYAVVAPTFDGSAASSGSLSFLRLFNGGSTAQNFTVSVVGSPSGRLYGTANISVPRNASPQYAVTGGSTSIVAQAGAAALNGGDTNYALYIQSSEPTAGYMHVTFNGGTNLFANMSVCKATLNEAIGAVSNSMVVTNAHTTQLGSFPSTVFIHNYWNAQSSYHITLAEGATGALKGNQITVTVPANATSSWTMANLQTMAGWTPASSELHANLIVTDTTGGAPAEVVSQQIVTPLGGNVDMSMACAVNPPTNSSSTGSGGLNGY